MECTAIYGIEILRLSMSYNEGIRIGRAQVEGLSSSSVPTRVIGFAPPSEPARSGPPPNVFLSCG